MATGSGTNPDAGRIMVGRHYPLKTILGHHPALPDGSQSEQADDGATPRRGSQGRHTRPSGRSNRPATDLHSPFLTSYKLVTGPNFPEFFHGPGL